MLREVMFPLHVGPFIAGGISTLIDIYIYRSSGNHPGQMLQLLHLFLGTTPEMGETARSQAIIMLTIGIYTAMYKSADLENSHFICVVTFRPGAKTTLAHDVKLNFHVELSPHIRPLKAANRFASPNHPKRCQVQFLVSPSIPCCHQHQATKIHQSWQSGVSKYHSLNKHWLVNHALSSTISNYHYYQSLLLDKQLTSQY